MRLPAAARVIWDQHGCLPLRPDPDAVEDLELYRRNGVDFVSVNAGFDLTSTAEVLEILSAFRQGIAAREDRFLLALTAGDVERAKRTGRLAVAFDLEGTEPLAGDVSRVAAFYDLGVRTMLIAYNRRNRAGGGCHDDPEVGLTRFGRAVVAEMNRVGMLVDAAHCSMRTTFDLFETSTSPVVFSHSVPLGVRRHERNISDEQMLGCAATGGVVGLNGVGLFLGENDASTGALVRAVDYAVSLVGAEHVGLGLDYVFDRDELNAFVDQNRDTFPPGGGYSGVGPWQFVSPEQLPELVESLLALGYGHQAVDDILGGNFLRIAGTVWR
jgi:membrane dipeptidase